MPNPAFPPLVLPEGHHPYNNILFPYLGLTNKQLQPLYDILPGATALDSVKIRGAPFNGTREVITGKITG